MKYDGTAWMSRRRSLTCVCPQDINRWITCSVTLSLMNRNASIIWTSFTGIWTNFTHKVFFIQTKMTLHSDQGYLWFNILSLGMLIIPGMITLSTLSWDFPCMCAIILPNQNRYTLSWDFPCMYAIILPNQNRYTLSWDFPCMCAVILPNQNSYTLYWDFPCMYAVILPNQNRCTLSWDFMSMCASNATIRQPVVELIKCVPPVEQVDE